MNTEPLKKFTLQIWKEYLEKKNVDYTEKVKKFEEDLRKIGGLNILSFILPYHLSTQLLLKKNQKLMTRNFWKMSKTIHQAFLLQEKDEFTADDYNDLLNRYFDTFFKEIEEVAFLAILSNLGVYRRKNNNS